MKYLLFILILCCAFPINAQQRGFIPTNAKGETEKRLALVIGNADYQGNILTNPLNDAKAMRTALQELGFTVQYYENLGKTAMEVALMHFSSDLHKHNVGLFYFAGHGFESKEKVNYLMSTDMNGSVNEALAKDKSLNLDVVIQSMQDANVNSNLLVIDACRNNPFRSWSRDGAKGLGSVSPALGTVVFFAASAGQAADDNRGGKNGLFTEELLSQIRKPNLELSDILKNTSRAVYKRSGGQMPAISGNLLEDFYFLRSNISENTNNPIVDIIPAKKETTIVDVKPIQNTEINDNSTKITIKGRIIESSDGSGLPGASITLKGTTRGTTSDANGNFKFENAPPLGTLVFTYVGYRKLEYKIEDRRNGEVIIKMKSKGLF